jgi:hypothetical protein
MEPYLHSPIHLHEISLHGVVLSSGKNLHLVNSWVMFNPYLPTHTFLPPSSEITSLTVIGNQTISENGHT